MCITILAGEMGPAITTSDCVAVTVIYRGLDVSPENQCTHLLVSYFGYLLLSYSLPKEKVEKSFGHSRVLKCRFVENEISQK